MKQATPKLYLRLQMIISLAIHVSQQQKSMQSLQSVNFITMLKPELIMQTERCQNLLI